MAYFRDINIFVSLDTRVVDSCRPIPDSVSSWQLQSGEE